ncbi:hypothetical protein GYB22_03325 [bacterium]|nr:hypothetical protein [bacterium]
MKYLSIVLAFFLFACGSPQTEEVVSKPPVPEQIDTSNSLVIGDPVSYSLDDILIFPVGRSYSPDIIKKKIPITPSSNQEKETIIILRSYYATDGAMMFDRTANAEFRNDLQLKSDIQNLIFYNKKTKKSYSLYYDSLHILSFAIHEDYKKPMIFYRIVKTDFNGDSMYTDEDAVVLYVSDLNGKNFKQITPDETYYDGYTEYLEDDMILVKTLRDLNGDSTFTALDETDYTEVDLIHPKFGESIFAEGLKDSLRVMMGRR